MTIREFLLGMHETARDCFLDLGRDVTMADYWQVVQAQQRYATAQALPRPRGLADPTEAAFHEPRST